MDGSHLQQRERVRQVIPMDPCSAPYPPCRSRPRRSTGLTSSQRAEKSTCLSSVVPNRPRRSSLPEPNFRQKSTPSKSVRQGEAAGRSQAAPWPRGWRKCIAARPRRHQGATRSRAQTCDRHCRSQAQAVPYAVAVSSDRAKARRRPPFHKYTHYPIGVRVRVVPFTTFSFFSPS